MLRSVSRVRGARIALIRSLSNAPAPSGGLSTSKAALTPTPGNPELRKWVRPLEPGALPAYDEALAYVERDVANKRAALAQVRDDEGQQWSTEQLEQLEVESEINLPEVRWNFNQGNIDLSRPVYRYLLNQQWRKMGRLDRLMERVYTMHVVPDVIPAIRPTVDLRLDFSSGSQADIISPPSSHKIPAKKLAVDLSDPAPEHFLLPSQTVNPPKVTAQVFHVEPRLYVLVMIDPDVPDSSNESYQNNLHWLVPNISLCAHSKHVEIPHQQAPTSPIVPYVPPHPQNGTLYHRYVILLLPQTMPIPGSAIESIERSNFDLRGFIKENGLLTYITKAAGKANAPTQLIKSGESVTTATSVDVEDGGGIAMWRETWDESVAHIYEKILALPEPKYGRPKKLSRYFSADEKKYSKYPVVATNSVASAVVDVGAGAEVDSTSPAASAQMTA